jgi:hypothetical protein
MFLEQPVRDRHELVIPTVVTGFAPANQQHRGAERIECIECAERPASDTVM